MSKDLSAKYYKNKTKKDFKEKLVKDIKTYTKKEKQQQYGRKTIKKISF